MNAWTHRMKTEREAAEAWNHREEHVEIKP